MSGDSYDLLVAGGTVVTAEGPRFAADVAIRGGRVVAFLEPGSGRDAEEIISAAGRIVVPGLIDAHVHPGVYRPLAEDLRALTAFGLRGGVTSMVAIHRHPTPYAELIPGVIEQFSAASLVDFGLIIGITTVEQIYSLQTAADLGIGAFKFYLGYRGSEARFGGDFAFSDDRLAEIIAQIAELPGDPMLAVHCENAELARYFKERALQSEERGLALYDAASDVASEVDAVSRVTLLASRANIRASVLHVSAGTTAEFIASAPWIRRERLTVETCPHYLALDTNDAAGTRAVVRPPIRSAPEVERLWRQLDAGVIDTIGSDHCANDLEAKAAMSVWECPLSFGESGLTLPVLLTEGHQRRGMSLEKIVAVTSANPAIAHRLYPRKGTIQIGSDADLAIVDLDAERTLDRGLITELKGRDDGSIYAGRRLRGWPVATVRAGRVVCDERGWRPEQPPGRFLPGAGQTSV
jgi:dihydroorotase-like cyclic amidohydrolase